MEILGLIALLVMVFELLNILSYRILKGRIVRRQDWDLNICCGKTDGGGVNADIIKHVDMPNFVKVDDIYNLPFEDGEFETVLCSHTMEHVNEPDRFYDELQRVGEEVTVVIPPLWDIFAVVNFWEHRWIFLTFSKEHFELPAHVRTPLSRTFGRLFGQKVKG
ncbi:MAG: methyltransferase domain-containing protein [Candidatus Brocadiia bacterium]